MYNLFSKELDKLNIEYTENVPMKEHTSFKIGGNADFSFLLKTLMSLKR